MVVPRSASNLCQEGQSVPGQRYERTRQLLLHLAEVRVEVKAVLAQKLRRQEGCGFPLPLSLLELV